MNTNRAIKTCVHTVGVKIAFQIAETVQLPPQPPAFRSFVPYSSKATAGTALERRLELPSLTLPADLRRSRMRPFLLYKLRSPEIGLQAAFTYGADSPLAY